MAAADKICARVHKLKAAGHQQWTAQCPAHEDKVNSLSIGLGTDGRVLLHCHAGCSPGAVLDALHMNVSDLFPETTAKSKTDPMAVYRYTDASGVLLFEVVRFPPKDFRQRRPLPGGQWSWDVKGVPRVPYRLPDLQGVTTVAIVEGEKDVNTLWGLNIPATCNAGGAGKWRESETQALKAAGCQRVIILPDNDSAGEAHALKVHELCKKTGIASQIIPLPGLGPHGDVSDWLSKGHTAGELLELFNKPYLVPKDTVLQAPLSPDKDPDRFPKTDLGNAEAFIERFGDLIRWDRTTEDWLIWSGHSWRRQAAQEVRVLAHQHVRAWQKEAAAMTDLLRRKALMEFTQRIEKSSAFDSLLKETKVRPPITVKGGWDEAPMLVGAPNGVIDLSTGTHRQGAPEDLITKMTGVPYEASATCPRWEAFVAEVFDHDPELIEYVQRAVGYSLTGITTEQCFFMAYGTGANGKSTFLVTLDHVFGDYAHTTDIRTFTVQGDAVAYEVAQLAGRRMIATSEVRTRSHLNEQIIKNFTGGERIEAQHKYGHPFTYRPTGKIWFAVNHQPRVSDESKGFWRRVRMIPFIRTFSGVQEDRKLGDKLRAEASGILNWAIRGCIKWQQQGLNPPTSVILATEAYQQAEDPVQEFLQERCVFGAAYRVQASDLYKAYATWVKENGMEKEALTGTGFGRYISKSFETVKAWRGKLYVGLTLKTSDMLSPFGED
jgi:putative DNA primase/helicase